MPAPDIARHDDDPQPRPEAHGDARAGREGGVTRSGPLILIAAAVLSGCTGERRHDSETANALERNNIGECYDCPLELGNGVTVPLS